MEHLNELTNNLWGDRVCVSERVCVCVCVRVEGRAREQGVGRRGRAWCVSPGEWRNPRVCLEVAECANAGVSACAGEGGHGGERGKPPNESHRPGSEYDLVTDINSMSNMHHQEGFKEVGNTIVCLMGSSNTLGHADMKLKRSVKQT
ncbi:uncharacterized protein LINC01750 [Tupaia chinensis]|uniref:uncharacterized protein LINC01750 n=1 Tax=Tupaia chinensis TaxID=246437 RepID=UPI000FFB8383|nr:uncharacterized protein LINC01750 [Tupaia chinensis]